LEFGKLPERSEAFTSSRRSASKQLKKDVGSVSRAQVDVLNCCTNSSKSDIVTTFSSCGLIYLTPVELKDVLTTFSDVIDFLKEGRCKLTALAV